MSPRADSLVELVAAIGEDAAERLREHFGGTVLYVPFELPDEHRICRAIGRDDAKKLCAWAGGGRVSVPKSDAVSLQARILRMREDKRSTADIAVACGISQRHVFRIMAEARRNAAT